MKEVDFLNYKIAHKDFGLGIVTKIENKYIYIQFNIGMKQFVFPDAFPTYLNFVDDKYNDMLESYKMQRKGEHDKLIIKNEIKNRRITRLVHFTSFENLESIMKNGLIPRNQLSMLGYDYKFNDESRADGRLDCLSLSISSCNHFLMNIFMNEPPFSNFVKISINPCILYDNKDKYFCYTNAANRSINQYLRSNNDYLLSSADSFKSMFKEKVKVSTRDRVDIYDRKERCRKSSETTDVQAEVLYAGIIKKEQFLDCEIVKNPYQADMPF